MSQEVECIFIEFNFRNMKWLLNRSYITHKFGPITFANIAYSLVSLNKVPTCFKNPVNTSCIDLILTNRPGCFMCTQVIETSLSRKPISQNQIHIMSHTQILKSSKMIYLGMA